MSLDPRYVGYLKPLLEEGISFVMANLRGGREYGEAWHRAGKGLNKKNVFLDYAAVLQDARKRRGWVAGWGASNGGLLVGAVLVWRPELMNAALIGYPVLGYATLPRSPHRKPLDRRIRGSKGPRGQGVPPELLATPQREESALPSHTSIHRA